MTDLVPLLISAGLGTAVGLERQIGHKPAGLRTHALVCVGATLIVLAAGHIGGASGAITADTSRVIQGVVTGIGFLGAGSIIRHDGFVHGLTTAASIWIITAIGLTVGVRAYELAIEGTALTLVLLIGFRWLEKLMTRGPGGSPDLP